MKKIIFLVVILSFLAAGTWVLAQDNNLPSPGLTPDSPFYFLKIWKEKIQIFFTFGAENKAKQFSHLAEVRMAEYQKMIEKGKTEIAQKTLEKYEEQLNKALEKVQTMENKGKNVQELVELISEKTTKHQKVLLEVYEKSPEKAKKGIEKAIEVSKKGFEEAIKAVSGDKKEELKEKSEEIKTLIEEKINFPKSQAACEKAGGDLCEAHEVCPSAYHLNLTETDRCCPNNCSGPTQYEFSTKRRCEIDPKTGKTSLCYCEPNENKNKVAVFFAKNGIYDLQEINSQVVQYYKSVKTALNMENAGLQKFEGKTMDELEGFVDSLYLNSDVGYIVLIGDDLPVADIPKENVVHPSKGEVVPSSETSYNLENLFAIHEKLEYVNRSRRESVYKGGYFENCKDVAISYILPPDLYSSTEKVDFVVKVLQTYTDYHNNFSTLISKYQKSVLHVYDPTILNADQTSYDISAVKVRDTEDEQITNELKNRPVILSLYMHGNQTNIGLGRYKTIEDFSNFVKENGTPALFVDSHSCQSVALKMENVRHCCWPQFYMGSGVWAYYIMTDSGGNEVRKIFPHEQNLGMAIRKNIIDQNFIFGDILAHMK